MFRITGTFWYIIIFVILQAYNYPDHELFNLLAVTSQKDSSLSKKEFEKYCEYCEFLMKPVLLYRRCRIGWIPMNEE